MKSLIIVTVVALCICGISADKTIDDALRQGAEISKQAQDALKLLKDQSRKTEAKRMEKDIADLTEVMEQLKKSTDDSEKIEILVKELQLLEKKLALEINMAKIVFPDYRNQLVDRGHDLLKQASEYLESHGTEGEQAKRIAEVAAELTKLVKQLEELDDMSVLIDLELKVIPVEHRLAMELSVVQPDQK